MREERARFFATQIDANRQMLEQVRRALGKIEMTDRHRIEAAGIDRSFTSHGSIPIPSASEEAKSASMRWSKVDDLENRKAGVPMATPLQELEPANSFRKLQLRPMTEHHDRSGLYQRTFAHLLQCICDVRIRVGWVEHDQVIRFGFAPQVALHRLPVHLSPIAELGSFQIFANHRGRWSSLLDEVGMFRPARKRLDSDRARTRIEIQHPIRLDPKRRQRGKDALADLVRHRPSADRWRTFQISALGRTGRYPHRVRSLKTASDPAPSSARSSRP